MSRLDHTAFVRRQYATDANLNARIALHETYSTAPEHFHDWLFDQIQLADRARVLEIGGGSGALWERVRARVPKQWRVTLTDFSYGMANVVREKFISPQFSFADCDAQHIPFASASFDAVLANHMLYHVPDVSRALAEFRRVLKPGGALYAATNGETHLQEIHALVASIKGRADFAPDRGFSLENGAAQLHQHFKDVTRLDHPNALRVTNADSLVAYILSWDGYRIAPTEYALIEELRQRVQNEIDAHGAFHITKAVGLFIARS